MKRVPVLATAIVAIACAAMIALGVWQLRRGDEKHALLALYERNVAMSSAVALPAAPVPDTMLFRRAAAHCLAVADWKAIGGRSVGGRNGFRQLAICKTGIEGPGFLADMGVSQTPDWAKTWRGGRVEGQLTLEPSSSSLLTRAFGKAPVPRPMIISAMPAPGLEASTPLRVEDVPDNHFAYAMQWFLFAGIAAVIYGIALYRRA